ncbi:MAG: hypothetical protein ACR2HO_06140 [Rubrobacteraceae bacterium]|nr:hypothetical protein [Actinomycetota bacterium]
MHGIERTRNTQGSPGEYNGVQRIVLRYSDGREVSFVPDAGAGLFSEDDILKLKEILDAASSVAEWAEVTERDVL